VFVRHDKEEESNPETKIKPEGIALFSTGLWILPYLDIAPDTSDFKRHDSYGITLISQILIDLRYIANITG